MGGLFSRRAIPVPDAWEGDAVVAAAQFASAPIDKLDVTAYNGDVLVQYLTQQLGWQPDGGQMIRRGNFRSIPGLSQVFPPGPSQLRFRRGTVGVAATIDFDAYASDDA